MYLISYLYEGMPNLQTVDGIKMNVYSAEHLPPHFHAIYNEHEVLLVISNGNIYERSLPATQLAKARGWFAQKRTEVLHVFYQLNPKLRQDERKKNKKSAKSSKNK